MWEDVTSLIFLCRSSHNGEIQLAEFRGWEGVGEITILFEMCLEFGKGKKVFQPPHLMVVKSNIWDAVGEETVNVGL